MQVADKSKNTRTFLALGIICLVLQLTLAPNLGIAGGRANFALVFVACSAPLLDSGRAALGGFLSGLVLDLSGSAPIGLMAFCLTIAGYVLSLERDRATGEFLPTLVRGACASLAVALVYHLAMLFVGQASSLIDVIVFRTLPTTLLTTVALAPFAYYFSRVRVSGSRLGSGLGSGLGTGGALGKGSHLPRRGL